jgi:type IV pilus assembly protein PilB
MARQRLGEMLLAAGAITEDALRRALAEHKRWGRSLGQTLVELKLLGEPELVHVLAQQLGVPVIELDLLDVPPEILQLVPAELAQRHDLVPFGRQLKFLDVAMADPADATAIHDVQTRTRLNVRPYLAGPNAVERALAKYYARGYAHRPRRDLSLAVAGGGDDLELELADDPVPLSSLEMRVAELEARVAQLEAALASMKP